MFSFVTKYFDQQARTLKRYEKVVEEINAFEPGLKKFSDKKLAAKTEYFKKQLESGQSLEQLLPEAYAVVREAARRTIGMRHYDVQLYAGIAFHEGKVAEQKTGEGKTLSATLPLYLNSLTGKGAHLITVNDYLSQIGAGWMGPIYHALGVSVGVIIHDQAYIYDPDFTGETRGDERLEHFKPVPRKEAYLADITYGTNNEFGFDYLRDNMAQSLSDQVQREKHFAIVDEADSIMIDEARTPLIISAPDSEPTSKYLEFNKLVKTLSKGADYQVDEKTKTATLTDLGVKRVERALGISNLYEESFDTIHHIEQALRANKVYQRDKDYVVRDGEVVIVDEHTGRLMFGRRYSDGLHQAIEAKEGAKVQQESRTLATISLQNYFRLYEKLAGMSGTAVTEAEELNKIYNVDVIAIPTNKPIQRIDFPDVVYKTTRAKYSAILREIEEIHATKRPILIGTRSIDQNQIISKLLTKNKIKHQLLNAKNHEREAFIIAEAGKPGAITVATNIAGRGVDIVLGGAKPERRNFKSEKEFLKAVEENQAAHNQVVAAGGLHIIGTERHESRRIDNQLRGRAGRQGDPGSSRFFVSLEDEIMRIFGGEQISKLMDTLRIDENMPIEHQLINKAITQAQIRVEGYFFDQRRNLVNYDDVLNRQRDIIYTRRQKILEQMEASKSDLDDKRWQERLADTFANHFQSFLTARSTDGLTAEELDAVVKELANVIPFDTNSLAQIKQQVKSHKSDKERLKFFNKIFNDIYQTREKQIGALSMRGLERYVFLSSIDEQWMNHLDDMTNLRDAVWLRGGKEQALAEYKKEAFQLFDEMIHRIELEALRKIFRLQVQKPAAAETSPDMVMSGPAKSSDNSTSALADTLRQASSNKNKISNSRSAKKGKRKTQGSYLKK